MNLADVKRLLEFDTPTVANGLEMLEVRDPSGGYAGPDVRALTPELNKPTQIMLPCRVVEE